MPIKRSSALTDTRIIYCGDNLDKLSALPDECVDLAYIDPPFNSNRTYEVFWETEKGQEERSFKDRHSSTHAYVEFLRPRIVQIQRVLKKTGSLYFHCDWHAVHYIKILLDQEFGERNFINEIIWKRQSAHNDAKQGSKHLGRVHDTILSYGKTKDYKFNHLYTDYTQQYIDKFYRHVEPETGRRYSLGDLGAPGGAAPSKGNPFYEFLGVKRYWRFSKEKMEQLYKEGKIVQQKPGSVPRQKRYLESGKGVPLGTVWDTINPLQGSANERVGYPTQKPVPLLERIIKLGSDEGDVVLDAFCGCGTALIAAELLGRQWIGIDISEKACRVVAQRLKDKCRLREGEAFHKVRKGFILEFLPRTKQALRKLPPHEFERWAVRKIGGTPNVMRGRDKGIDGRVYLVKPEVDTEHHGHTMHGHPVQVKQKDVAGRPDIDQFETAMKRARADVGYFVSFKFSKEAEDEIERFRRDEGKHIVSYTVEKLLEMETVAVAGDDEFKLDPE